MIMLFRLADLRSDLIRLSGVEEGEIPVHIVIAEVEDGSLAFHLPFDVLVGPDAYVCRSCLEERIVGGLHLQ